MKNAIDVAKLLLDIDAVKISISPPFTWTSGIRSPIYCDNRKLISYPRERAVVVDAFVELIRKIGATPEYIAGTATAAIPWAAFVAQRMALPMVYIRPERKEHGAGRQVEGWLPPGKKVLIVEDLISTGGSALKAAEAVMSECQAIVTNIVAIVTYEFEEAAKSFREKGIAVSTLTNFSALSTAALERGSVTQEQWENILGFKADPRGWAAKKGI